MFKTASCVPAAKGLASMVGSEGGQSQSREAPASAGYV